jgi:peptide/nickel transport system permease protein
MLYAQIIALVIAIPLGVFTAYRAGTRSDRSINAGAFALLALPSFVLALALAYWVGVKWKPDLPILGQIPVSGYEPGWMEALFGAPTGDLAKHFATLLLPAIALAAGLIAVYMRLLRSDMIATLQENYITMARSKGLSDKRILWRHALRPSSLTLLTVAGLNFGTLIGGAVAVEVIFQIPGIGTLIYQAINARQIVELQSYIAIIAIGYVLINFTIDALYVVLDPRIRRARA